MLLFFFLNMVSVKLISQEHKQLLLSASAFYNLFSFIICLSMLYVTESHYIISG